MRAISRNLKTTKSADKSILAQTNEARERELERDKNGLRDQARDIHTYIHICTYIHTYYGFILVEIHTYHFECNPNMTLRDI